MSALIATWPLAARRVPRLQWAAVVLITLAIWGNFGTLVALSSATLLIIVMTIPRTLLLWQKSRKDSRASMHAEPPRREGVIRPFAPAEPGVPEKAAKMARGTVNLARSRSTELGRDLKKLMLLPMVLYNFVQHIDWSRLREFVDARIVPYLNKLDKFLEGRERALYATPDSTPTTPEEGAMNDNDGREDTPVNEDRLAVLEGIRRLRLRNTGFDSDGTAYAPGSAAARMARYGAGTDVIDPDPYDQALNLASGGGSDAAIDYDFAAPPTTQVPRPRSDLDTLFDGTDDDVVSTGSAPTQGTGHIGHLMDEASEANDPFEPVPNAGVSEEQPNPTSRYHIIKLWKPAVTFLFAFLIEMLFLMVDTTGMWFGALIAYVVAGLVIYFLVSDRITLPEVHLWESVKNRRKLLIGLALMPLAIAVIGEVFFYDASYGWIWDVLVWSMWRIVDFFQLMFSSIAVAWTPALILIGVWLYIDYRTWKVESVTFDDPDSDGNVRVVLDRGWINPKPTGGKIDSDEQVTLEFYLRFHLFKWTIKGLPWCTVKLQNAIQDESQEIYIISPLPRDFVLDRLGQFIIKRPRQKGRIREAWRRYRQNASA